MRLESGADPLLAGLVGSPAVVSGGDPAPYAERAFQIWSGATEQEPAPEDGSIAQQAGIKDWITGGIGDVVNRAGLVLLGVIVVAFGLYIVAKD